MPSIIPRESIQTDGQLYLSEMDCQCEATKRNIKIIYIKFQGHKMLFLIKLKKALFKEHNIVCKNGMLKSSRLENRSAKKWVSSTGSNSFSPGYLKTSLFNFNIRTKGLKCILTRFSCYVHWKSTKDCITDPVIITGL